LFYEDLLSIQKAKSKAEIQLIDFKQPLDLLSGFVVIRTPINGNLKYGLISLLIGYIVSLLVSALLENRKGIVKYFKRK